MSRRLHGSSVAWCSEEKTTTEVSRGSGAGEEVDRVGRVAGEDDDVVLAGADEAGDLVAGGLVVGARDAGEPARAAVHARVGAGGLGDGPRDPLEAPGSTRRGRGWRSRRSRPTGSARARTRTTAGRSRAGTAWWWRRADAVAPASGAVRARRASGATEAFGAAAASGTRAVTSGTARSRGRRWNEDGVVLAIDTVGVSRGQRTSGTIPGSRACRRPTGSPTRSSPGAPHRGGGLLASEPGLVAGTHDLRRAV